MHYIFVDEAYSRTETRTKIALASWAVERDAWSRQVERMVEHRFAERQHDAARHCHARRPIRRAHRHHCRLRRVCARPSRETARHRRQRVSCQIHHPAAHHHGVARRGRQR